MMCFDPYVRVEKCRVPSAECRVPSDQWEDSVLCALCSVFCVLCALT